MRILIQNFKSNYLITVFDYFLVAFHLVPCRKDDLMSKQFENSRDEGVDLVISLPEIWSVSFFPFCFNFVR